MLIVVVHHVFVRYGTCSVTLAVLHTTIVQYLVIGLQNGEWICRKRQFNCPAVSCKGKMITMSCCPVCVGDDTKSVTKLDLSQQVSK